MFKDAATLDRQRTADSFDTAHKRYAAQAEKWFDGSAGSVDRRLTACDGLLHRARATVARLSSITDSRRYLAAAERLDADRRALTALRDDLLTGASSREDVVGPPGWRTATRHEAHWFKDDGSYAVPNDGGPHPRNYASPHEYLQARNLHHWIGQSEAANPGAGDYPVSDLGHAQTGGHGYRPPANTSRRPPPSRLVGADRRWVQLESARFVAANTDTLDDNHELATRAHAYAALKTSTFTPSRSAVICEQFVARVASLGRQSYRPPVHRVAQYQDFDPALLFLT